MKLRAILALLCGLTPCRAQLATQAAAQPAAKQLLQQIHTASLDPEQCYRVREMDLAREDVRLYLTEGYLIFSKPVQGERISAVFTDEVESGDGEVLLLPPFRGERQSLARFTQSPNLDEHFHAAVLVASDGSVQALLDRVAREGAARKAPEMGPLLAEQWTPALASLQSRYDLRLARDLLTPPAGRAGMLSAAIAGKRLGNFEVYYDQQAQNQITVGRLTGPEKHSIYEVWTNFPARSHRNAAAKPAEAPFSEERFQIEASLDADLRLTAKVRTWIKAGSVNVRALAFEAAQAIEITSARVDGQPAELLRNEDTPRGNAVTNAQNTGFLVVPATELAAASTHEVEFEERGSVISPAGNGVYFVAARSNWYPRGGGGTGLAFYDMTFRYPKLLTLVTAGEATEDRIEGDVRVTRRVTPVPIRMAGFNLGDYEKATGSAPGVRVEVYGNRGLEAALQPRVQQPAPADPDPQTALGRGRGRANPNVDPLVPPPPVLLPPPAPNPLARLQTVADDISAAVQFFSGLFGPPALKTLAVSPIPGPFGQGFPGLVYLSTLSYLNPNQRPDSERGAREQVFFSDLIAAHEAAHQWWGDAVIPASYQDDWLSEGLANYSALMYLEKKRGVKAMEDVLEGYRDSLLKKDSTGAAAESAGPITWGFRLESAGDSEAWHDITYYKSAWILHMLRRRMGDERFLKMLAETRRRYDSRSITTEQFLALVKEFAPPRAAGVKTFNAEAFFDNWVYATGVPGLKLTYTVMGAAPAVRISGTIEQSGVDDDFSMEAPVEIQFAKGAPQTIWVQTSNDGASFSATLKEMPVKVSIPAGRGVLAVKR